MTTDHPTCPDPIECGHEAALGLAEMRLEMVHATATAWARPSMSAPSRVAGRHLLRLLDGEPHAAAGPAPATDQAARREGVGAALEHGPVRCPLCPDKLMLHTPTGARAHFEHVHPERQITGPGPWPMLVDRADEERLASVVRWVTSDVVTAKTEFGNGYRAAQRDIRDLIKGRFDADAANELRRLADETPQPGPAARSCPNCDGIDPSTCLTNPDRTAAPAVAQPDEEADVL